MSHQPVNPPPYRETPVFVRNGQADLFAVVTQPRNSDRSLAVILAPGGSPRMVSFDRNRIATRLARRLAELGCHVVRFDYHGTGDSGGDDVQFRLERPFAGDVVTVVEWLKSYGIDRFVLVGSCFGARTCMAAAPRVPGLAGVVLMSVLLIDQPADLRADRYTVGDYFRRGVSPSTLRSLRDPRVRRYCVRLVQGKTRAVVRRLERRLIPRSADSIWWMSRTASEELRWLAAQRIPVLLLYGTEDPGYRRLVQARRNGFGAFLDEPGTLVELAADWPGVLHGHETVAGQTFFMDRVTTWLDTRVLSSTDCGQLRKGATG